MCPSFVFLVFPVDRQGQGCGIFCWNDVRTAEGETEYMVVSQRQVMFDDSVIVKRKDIDALFQSVSIIDTMERCDGENKSGSKTILIKQTI